MDKNWRNNPKLKGIDPNKLNILIDLLSQADTKKNDELIPFFLAATAKANSMGVSFSDNETDLILNVLKTNMTEEEIKRLDTVRRLARLISSNNSGQRR